MYALNMIFIEQIPVMFDNYVYILIDKSTNQTACVDPGVTNEIIIYIDERKLGLNYIKYPPPFRSYRWKHYF